MLKPSHPGGAKTFSELKDSRNSLKQVKKFEASQNVSAALQEGFRIIAIRVLFSRNRTFVGFKVLLRMGFHTMKHNRDPESKPKL